MNRVVTILFLCCSLVAVSQHSHKADKTINASNVFELEDCSDSLCSVSKANIDIENDRVILLLESGYAPIINIDMDKKFEKKFKCYYFELGCIGLKEEVSAAYNFRMFDYLNQNYGIKWMDYVRKDVVGYSKWKKQNHVQD